MTAKDFTHEQVFLTYEQVFLTYEQAFVTHEQAFVTHEQVFVTYEQAFLTHEQVFVTYEQAFLTYEQVFVTYEQVFVTHEHLFVTYEQAFLTRDTPSPTGDAARWLRLRFALTESPKAINKKNDATLRFAPCVKPQSVYSRHYRLCVSLAEFIQRQNLLPIFQSTHSR
ncbi:hypothetical protein [Brasilonema sp. UFV-L1]|uniref:hypothetical protein n=1 Tax=Brasilonema sp. UFV-L1 TaxID=2234130 RepID=UPI00145EFE8C|nr:hypothetical protein [Brasilonema sp. UFV-L1]